MRASSPEMCARSLPRDTLPTIPAPSAVVARPASRNARSRATTLMIWNWAAAADGATPRRAPSARMSRRSRQYAFPRRGSGKIASLMAASKRHHDAATAATSSNEKKPPPKRRPTWTWNPVESFVLARSGGCRRAAATSTNSSTSTASSRMTWDTTSIGNGASSCSLDNLEGLGCIDPSAAAVHNLPQSRRSAETPRDRARASPPARRVANVRMRAEIAPATAPKSSAFVRRRRRSGSAARRSGSHASTSRPTESSRSARRPSTVRASDGERVTNALPPVDAVTSAFMGGGRGKAARVGAAEAAKDRTGARSSHSSRPRPYSCAATRTD
mmetsp:Transcript_33268/g.103104  ORF Transcript_33268/g.103104 Transcript_33268/m.103104 type:complete len:329 (-) Transcript_33268:54-1040(-)